MPNSSSTRRRFCGSCGIRGETSWRRSFVQSITYKDENSDDISFFPFCARLLNSRERCSCSILSSLIYLQMYTVPLVKVSRLRLASRLLGSNVID